MNYLTMRNNRLLVFVRRLLVVILVGGSLYFLVSQISANWNLIRGQLAHLWWPGVFIALALTMLSICLGAGSWAVIARGIGSQMDVRGGIKTHLVANLGKYMPGYIWQYVGKATIGRAQGIPIRISSAAIVLELVVLLGSGIIVLGLLWAAVALRLQSMFSIARPVGLLVMGVSILGLFVWPNLSQPIYRRLNLPVDNVVQRSAILLALTLDSAGWLALGLSAWFLGRSVDSISLTVIPDFIAATIVAAEVSFLVLFVPFGLGIREGVLTLGLSLVVAAPIAATIAIGTRLILILGELILFAWATRL